jgi:hypothetical protein
MLDVVLAAGEKVVHANDVMAFRKQALAKMRPEEPSAPCDEDRSVDPFPTIVRHVPTTVQMHGNKLVPCPAPTEY